MEVIIFEGGMKMAKETIKDILKPRKKDSDLEVNWPLRIAIGSIGLVIFIVIFFI